MCVKGRVGVIDQQMKVKEIPMNATMNALMKERMRERKNVVESVQTFREKKVLTCQCVSGNCVIKSDLDGGLTEIGGDRIHRKLHSLIT